MAPKSASSGRQIGARRIAKRGIGWRTNFGGTLGLIGSLDGVVRLHLREPQRRRFFGIPMRVRDVYVSLEDPAGFLAALRDGRD